MYVQRNTEARSRKNFYGRKAVLYILSAVCVCSLSYPACKAHAPYYIVIRGLSVYNTLLHINLINDTVFGGGGGSSEHKMCVLIFSTPLKHFSF